MLQDRNGPRTMPFSVIRPITAPVSSTITCGSVVPRSQASSASRTAACWPSTVKYSSGPTGSHGARNSRFTRSSEARAAASSIVMSRVTFTGSDLAEAVVGLDDGVHERARARRADQPAMDEVWHLEVLVHRAAGVLDLERLRAGVIPDGDQAGRLGRLPPHATSATRSTVSRTRNS